jgi:signal transduction histidine kinase
VVVCLGRAGECDETRQLDDMTPRDLVSAAGADAGARLAFQFIRMQGGGADAFSSSDCHHVLDALRQLSGANELDAVMRVVRTTARALTGADGATFVLRRGDSVLYADEDAIAPLWKGRTFPVAECVSGWCMERGEAIAIADVFADPRVPSVVYEPTFVKSMLMVPIRQHDPMGAIGTYWASRHEASVREIELLQVLADAVSVAVDRATLISAEREARERAERIQQAQADMLRIVAHDIRNPLNAMMMGASLLLRVPADTEIGQRVQKHAGAVHRAGVRMERLIAQLVDYGRLEAGVFSVSPRPVPVSALLEHVKEIEDVARKDGHAIVVSPPSDGLAVVCDADRIVQVLSNLVGNSVKHTPPGGTVSVLASPEGDRAVRFTVADDGPGIPEEVRADLFTRYGRRADSARGTGLGLFITRGIV